MCETRVKFMNISKIDKSSSKINAPIGIEPANRLNLRFGGISDDLEKILKGECISSCGRKSSQEQLKKISSPICLRNLRHSKQCKYVLFCFSLKSDLNK